MRNSIPIGVLVVGVSLLSLIFAPADPISHCVEWVVWSAVGLGMYVWGLRVGATNARGVQEAA